MHSNKWNTAWPIYMKLFFVSHDVKIKGGTMQEVKRITKATVLRKGDPWRKAAQESRDHTH